MAYDIGIRVGVDGEAGFKKSLNSLTTETKNYKSALKALQSEFDATGGSEDRQAAKIQILGRQYDAQKRKVDLLKSRLDALRSADNQNADAINRTAAEYNRAAAELQKLERELAEARSQAIQLGQAMEKTGENIQKQGMKMQNAGRALTMALTLPVAALGAAAVKAEMDFSASMSKVGAISGATGEELDALRDKAQEMGENTAFTAKEAGDAMSYMALAGWKADQMLAGIKPVMDLAAASGEDLATVSDIVTDDLTAFGLTADDAARFTDVLAAAMSNSNTNVSQMGEAFKYAAPLAGALGYSVDDVAVALGIMANNGIKASTAGTTLRSLFTRMSKPTKESAQAMNDLNISLSDADGNMRPLSEVIGQMRDGFAGLTEQEKASYAAMLGGQRAMSGLLAIVNSTQKDFDALTDSIANADGAAGRMAATMLDNTKGSLTLMKSALEGAAISAGQALAPTVTKVAETVQRAAKAFSNLTKNEQKNIIKTVAVVAAIGPVLSIGGKVVSLVGKAYSGIGKLLIVVGKHIAKSSAAAAAMAAEAAAKQANEKATEKLIAKQMILNAVTSPVVLLVMAGAMLAASAAAAALSQAFGVVSRETEKMVDEINSGTEHVRSSIENMHSSFDESTASAEGQARSAKALIDRLEELSAKTDRTAEEQAEMKSVVDILNNTFPDMQLNIDGTTGALSKSITELRKYVEQTQRAARANAYAKVQEDAYTTLAEAEMNAAKASNEVKKAKEEQAEAEAALAAHMEAGIDKTHDAETATRSYNTELTALQSKATNAGANVRALETAERDATAAVKEAQEQVTIATEGLRLNAQASYESAEAHRLRAAAEHQGAQAAETAADVWNNLSAVEKVSAEQIVASVDGIKTACAEAIESQMNMFEQFSGGAEISTEQLLDNMQSQIDGITQWEQNLTTLAERGINQGLLEQLSSMGPKGASYVQAFVDASSEELAQAGALWDQGLNIKGFENEEAQKLQDAFGTLAAGGEAGIQELGQKLQTAMDANGKYTIDGLVNGIRANVPNVTAAMTETAEAAEGGYTGFMEQASPSRRMARDGRFTVQGLAEGMRAGAVLVQTTAQAVGRMAAYVGSTARGFVGAAYNAGQAVADGLARGIYAGRSAVVTAAQDIARRTIEAAKNVLGVASPSKEFYKIGGYSVAGYVNALADGSRAVYQQSLSTFSPAYAASYPSMVAGSSTMNVGGISVNVYGAPGQDVNELADVVGDRIARELIRRATT